MANQLLMRLVGIPNMETPPSAPVRCDICDAPVTGKSPRKYRALHSSRFLWRSNELTSSYVTITPHIKHNNCIVPEYGARRRDKVCLSRAGVDQLGRHSCLHTTTTSTLTPLHLATTLQETATELSESLS